MDKANYDMVYYFKRWERFDCSRQFIFNDIDRLEVDFRSKHINDCDSLRKDINPIIKDFT
ncbi:hypothetical protein [Nitrosomonas ureae]|uniref:Uncharacterized protein n=1 Tax=Nitrosomonas ureae TaxID=44577 RepID=A0A286A729_9PROT|nr:hypothetical protein [Nitrosomonas ureae]SOD17718.1 hypothetical protein SAMN06297164_1312 [Nitrosomonas ureae]